MSATLAIDRARIDALRTRLERRARVDPAPGTIDVLLDDQRIGQTRRDVAHLLAAQHRRCRADGQALVFVAEGLDRSSRTALLADVAVSLRDAGLLRGWRNELLDVRPRAGGAPLAAIERAACRVLGIATHAVHLNAFTADGRLTVARRADNKSVDPGLWDNLVGGMVAAGETELEALARETYEEAGLDLASLTLARGSLVFEARPVREGYMVETVQVFDTVLPRDAAPRNLDGEVAAIERRTVGEVLAAIERDEFTLESALVTLDGLVRRAGR